MKLYINIIASLGLALAPAAVAQDTQAPDADELLSLSYPEVIDRLGQPNSTLSARDTTIALFDDLKVTFEMGVATKVSPADKYPQPDPEQRRQIGLRLKQRYLSSPTFNRRPPEEQLAAWHQFQAMYPEVDISAEIEALRERIAKRQDTQAELDSLIALAEAEARIEEARNRHPDVIILPDQHSPFFGHFGKGRFHKRHDGRDHDHDFDRDRRPRGENVTPDPLDPHRSLDHIRDTTRLNLPGPTRPLIQPRD